MSKPILWLGPLEDLDVDFDPLLGRSAAKPKAAATFTPTPTPAPLSPLRSVFDDPVAAEPPISARVPESVEEFVPESVPEPVSKSVTAHAPVVSAWSEDVAPITPEPVVTRFATVTEQAVETPEPTDFTHNNEPIPARQKANTTEAEPILGSGKDSATKPRRKAFFASLFSLPDNSPAVAGGGASINDIWAKSASKPDPVQDAEPVQDPELVPDVTPEPVVEEPIAPEVDTQAVNKPAKSVNIWADIDQKIDEDVAAEAATNAVLDTPTEDGRQEREIEAIETSQAVVEPEPLGEVEPAIEEVVNDAAHVTADAVPDVDVEQVAVPPKPVVELIQPADILAAPVDAAEVVSDVGDLEPETVGAATIVEADIEQPIAASSSFQSAFNADKFWSLPPNQKQQSQEVPAEQLTQNYVDTPSPTLPAEDLSVAPALEVEPLPEPDLEPALAPTKPQLKAGARRKKKVKKNYVGAFFGTFLFGVVLIMTLVSSLAAFGYPFDMISSYRWYWVMLAVMSAGIWGLSRGWKMVAASFLVMGINLFVTVPATGKAPVGGKTATAVVGWANVAGNNDALARIFKDADKKRATLLMLTEAPQGVFTPPAGWSLIEAPVAGDPTAIAVLSKSDWRAATVPGEPTMARPAAGDLTVIGVHPHDAQKARRRTPMRDALINRAGTRAGIQEGPTLVVGDFNAAPWDQAMTQFRKYGNVTRVRCGGWAGSTLTQAFGLIGVATDHAYVRDVTVTHCQLGSALSGGNHNPIWLYVKPAPAAAAPTEQP